MTRQGVRCHIWLAAPGKRVPNESRWPRRWLAVVLFRASLHQACGAGQCATGLGLAVRLALLGPPFLGCPASQGAALCCRHARHSREAPRTGDLCALFRAKRLRPSLSAQTRAFRHRSSECPAGSLVPALRCDGRPSRSRASVARHVRPTRLSSAGVTVRGHDGPSAMVIYRSAT